MGLIHKQEKLREKFSVPVARGLYSFTVLKGSRNHLTCECGVVQGTRTWELGKARGENAQLDTGDVLPISWLASVSSELTFRLDQRGEPFHFARCLIRG